MATPAPMLVWALSQLLARGGSASGGSACSLYNVALRDIVLDAALGRLKRGFIWEAENLFLLLGGGLPTL